MNSYLHKALRQALVTLAVTLAAMGTASAADVFLKAQRFPKDLPGGASVRVWGFALCDAAWVCGTPSVPGPVIEVAAGDALTISLRNELPVPVSLAIPGQSETTAGRAPVVINGRVQSFTLETARAGTAGDTQTYTWSALKPGTFLYESGTHPSIHVPMGLYGGLVVREPGSVYRGRAYDAETLLLFSEIDHVQNAAADAAAVAWSGAGGAPAYPSTIDYTPKYFLVNGAAYDAAAPTALSASYAAGLTEGQLLVRLLNAGLRPHVATAPGLEFVILGEDGNALPTPLHRVGVLLPAGKTHDVLAATPANRTYVVFDRMLDLTNADAPQGGMMVHLQLGTGSTPPGPTTDPLAHDDSYAVVEDTALAQPAPGVLANDDPGLLSPTVVTPPSNGTLILNADGSFTYTPNAGFSGTDSFSYIANNGTNVASVQLQVSFVNDAPVAAADAYTNSVGTTISVDKPGVLGNDSDPDGDDLVATLVGSVAGLTLNPDGSFVYAGGVSVTFDYTVSDGQGGSSAASVTLAVQAPSGLALNVIGPGGAVADYRWLVEEDTTWHPDPAAPTAESLGTSFHRSYMPVVGQGCLGSTCETQIPFSEAVLDPTKRYYVSVLPTDINPGTGYTMGGAPIAPGAASVDVRVHTQPIPTAQISVFAFEDMYPTNGAPDGDTVERGLASFQVVVEDAGGRYGISGGQAMMDVDGMPLRNAKAGQPGCTNAAAAPAGVILTCSDGTALIKNLPPGKFGIQIVPPANATTQWVQTTTIEGTKVQDAWVKPNEPAYFQEFGPPSYHVSIGFARPKAGPGGPNVVTGRVTNLHMSRPPNQTLYDSGSRDALAHTTAWVGLNEQAGVGANIATVKADADGNFTLAGIPSGTYQLVVWDDYLDQIIAFRAVTLPGGGALGNVPVFNWFSRLEHNVFLDANANGARDDGEMGLPEQNVNLRFRDGTINQAFPTDHEGFVPFDEVFPFFSWQVAEVDYTRFKATGVTVTVDNGGDVSGTGGVLNPQIQAGGGSSRTEVGPQLLQAYQGFIGQTSILDWGKKPFLPGENGGISGIVYYAVTRAENDPRLAAAEPWEPGIPRATVRLHRVVERADGTTGLTFVQEVQTDSWDDNLPTDCPAADTTDPLQYDAATGTGRCFDGMRTFNQVRPGVFDGGYAFNDIPPGKYVVEVVPPPGYELVKEEDKNVDFGDAYVTGPIALMLPNLAMALALPDQATLAAAAAPEPGLAQPPCVGDEHVVPAELSLFPGIEAGFAGMARPLCDRKEVVLNDQANGVADFYLFTKTPVAAHFTGMILDDLTQEFNPNAPTFGEKWAPPFVPVAIRDWAGHEIGRVYADQWGLFNGLLPSTMSANLPMPSGMSPGMYTTCMNDPGPIPGPGGTLITDPQHDPRYSNFCYTFQYMPGATTYLDTPVLPVSAFAAGDGPVDCAYPAGTPAIRQVNGTGLGPFLNPTQGRTFTIISEGPAAVVPNPDYAGPQGTQPKTATRDHGFGSTPGTVRLGTVNLLIDSWTPEQIVASIPLNPGGQPIPVPLTTQLTVTRGDNGRSNVASTTVTVSAAAAHQPIRVAAGGSIQAAIDAAAPGRLILVEPGTYEELVIMWKPVRLQGSGAGSTIINAVKTPAEKLEAWRTRVANLISTNTVTLLPGQANNEPAGPLDTEQGAAVTVMGIAANANARSFTRSPSRVDGFLLTGGDAGGAVMVNGYAHNLEISNNRVSGNSGYYHGGIRIGHPFLQLAGNGPFQFNNGIRVHNNAVTQNGGLDLATGGGLSICTGTNTYQVADNFICGNFTMGNGGGIGHFGLSNNGQILRNTIVFNQSFNQGLDRSGGGIFVGGEPPLGGVGLSRGSGNVALNANLIQGNQAGAGHGGGVRLENVNGQEVAANPGNNLVQIGRWYQVNMTNNIIANNVAGWSGAGVSMLDAARVNMINNTITSNDSTATVGSVFNTNPALPDPNVSSKQPAGVASQRHSLALSGAFANNILTALFRQFSNPVMLNNLVWRNRSFHYDGRSGVARLEPVLAPAAIGDCDPNAYYWDLGVLDPTFQLRPTFSVLTSLTGPDGKSYTTSQLGLPAFNTTTDPAFVAPYCNGARTLRLVPGVTTLQVAPALDEGGNWIDVRFGPISLTGDYHIQPTSPARSSGFPVGAPSTDFDNQNRTLPIDRGADEVLP